MACHMQVHGAVYISGEYIILEIKGRTNGNVYEFHIVELRTKIVLWSNLQNSACTTSNYIITL